MKLGSEVRIQKPGRIGLLYVGHQEEGIRVLSIRQLARSKLNERNAHAPNVRADVVR